jgi:hypothetical protein
MGGKMFLGMSVGEEVSGTIRIAVAVVGEMEEEEGRGCEVLYIKIHRKKKMYGIILKR